MTIGAGYAHTCLIDKNEEINCYGLDTYAQVSDTPTSDTYNFISSGRDHNCAISSTTFKITCWGWDDDNQVSDTPTSDIYDFISSGTSHNCAIVSTTSKITCWGYDDFNQTSDPNNADLQLFVPTPCQGKFLSFTNTKKPTPLTSKT